MSSFTILFQGDSITDCGRHTCGGEGYSNGGIGPGYPNLIASRLTCDHPEVEWNFINTGISGNRIVDLYARWKMDTLNRKPDLLSILIGVNDTGHEINHQNGVEPERAERIYRELLSWTKQVLPECRLVLFEPFIGAYQFPAWVPEINQRRAITKKLASEFGAVFIPMQKILDEAGKRAPAEHWFADGIHLKPAGHQLMADAFFQFAGPLLPVR